jgi:hypothetical protein
MGTGSFQGVEAAGAWGLPLTPIWCRKVLEKSTAIPLFISRACVAHKKGEKPPTYNGAKKQVIQIGFDRKIIVKVLRDSYHENAWSYYDSLTESL